MNYTALIVAAGSGTRMGLGYNKAYYRPDERTILEHTMEIFQNDADCTQIVVVTDPEMFEIEIQRKDKTSVTAGGNCRQGSVANGLRMVKEEYVFVHDGARPYLSSVELERLKNEMTVAQAACLMVPCKDTIKRVVNGIIETTYDRSTLYAAQTPQAFATELLRDCMRRAEEEGFSGTDDCSLVERYGNVPVHMVEGSYANFKITTIEDL